MPARDFYHETVRKALEADGWVITHDPYFLRLGKRKGYMDKINKYKKIVGEFATYIASISPSDESVETQLITDDKHGHYLLFSVGWANTYREYSPFVHIDVKPDGKVWIQHDGTDLKIALLLAEKGIPKKDIVIGFRNIEQRQHLTDFAVS